MNYEPIEIASHMLVTDHSEDPLLELVSRLFKVTLLGDDETGADILNEFVGNRAFYEGSHEAVQAVLYALAGNLKKRAEMCVEVLSVMDFDKKKQSKKVMLTTAQRRELMNWYTSHPVHPYPTRSEKEHLSKVTGMNLKQIENWFINARRRQPTHY
jgi:Homeobox KN domain